MERATRVTLGDEDYVILPQVEYRRLVGLSKAADLPKMPKANARGEFPAVAYARASLARKLIQARVNAGLSQRALAKLAGVRFETICRIETGKHSPNVATVDRIERAIMRKSRRATRAPM